MATVHEIKLNGRQVEALTKKQQALFEYCLAYMSEHQHMPTRKEAGEHFGIGINAVYEHMVALERKGWIERTEANSSRYRLAVTTICFSGIEEVQQALAECRKLRAA